MKTGLNTDGQDKEDKVLCVGCKEDWREVGTTRVGEGEGWHNCSTYFGTTKCQCEECIKRREDAIKEAEEKHDLWREFVATFEEWKAARGK